jgi:hypothetical protein
LAAPAGNPPDDVRGAHHLPPRPANGIKEAGP